VDEIYRDLALCGVRETTLFPDLEGLSREIKEQWMTLTFSIK